MLRRRLSKLSSHPRGDPEGWDLASARGYVGEAGGAQARQEAGKLAPKQIRSEIDEHVFKFDAARRRDPGEDFAADGYAFLHDPAAGVAASADGGNRSSRWWRPNRARSFPIPESRRCPRIRR